MMKENIGNHLKNETSPYLKQHALNPVDWYPWGDEAFNQAIREDKPIFLSIGYSSCHWCHVMAHESFENEDIAQLLNDKFVSIKVDREENPDVDSVYMEAVQSITGSGGWPLTVFLTPDRRPFYGGTYFPPQDRAGMAGLERVLNTVWDAYRNRRGEVEQATEQIAAALKRQQGRGSSDLNPEVLNNGYLFIKDQFDNVNGGFRGAPKFPQPSVLEFMLNHYYRNKDVATLDMVVTTLEKMARGGIYDQLGGGFHRYSTDSRWLVPHFEKMLYDNAQLARLYTYAFQITHLPFLKNIAEETTDYVLREMTSPEGGFYTAQDADSEGVEGKYYTWTPGEIVEAIGADRAQLLIEYYGVTADGNFDGRNVLHVAGSGTDDEPDEITEAKRMLLKSREKRVHPGRDEKVLVSWNGLMLSALTEAATVLDRTDYLEAAVTNGEFLLKCIDENGHLPHVYREGKRGSNEGYLEDYAQTGEAFLSLHAATGDAKWLRESIRLCHIIKDEFRNESERVFYDTPGHKKNELFVRPRNTMDGAIPSGASAATKLLLKTAALNGDAQMNEAAKASLESIQKIAAEYPLMFGNWLCALDLYFSGPAEILIYGPTSLPAIDELLKVINENWTPNKVTIRSGPENISEMPDMEFLKGKTQMGGQPTVFICIGSTCQLPVTDPEELRKKIAA